MLDKVYVINMDRDGNRLEEFDHMMKKLNWNYERFSAIDGKKLMSNSDNPSMQGLKRSFIKDSAFLTSGEIGCMLSHVILWDKLVNTPELNRIAIFEDDARTHIEGNTLTKYLEEFYEYIGDKEPDMLYLGKSLDNCLSYERVMGNIYRSKHPLCLHAYIITKEGARKLLNMGPYHHPIDIIPIKAAEQNIIDIMVFHPSIFFQDIFGATSNLRKLKEGINSTTECLIYQQHLASDTLGYLGIVLIGLVLVILIFYMEGPLR